MRRFCGIELWLAKAEESGIREFAENSLFDLFPGQAFAWVLSKLSQPLFENFLMPIRHRYLFRRLGNEISQGLHIGNALVG